MSPFDQSEVETVFAAVIEAAAADRAAVLDRRCAGRPDLRAEVLSLVDAHDLTQVGLTTGDREAIGRAAALAFGAAGASPQVGTRIAHYRLDGRLGAGGMGEVHRAWDLAIGRPAAVKLVRPGVSLDLTRRLLREVEASGRLQHPGIATFYEGGEDQGRAYVAMELVEGSTLRSRVDKGPIPVDEALRIIAGLLEALAHAHAAGVLHRDIKPENIMLRSTGVPKLLDFGLAHRLAGDVAATKGRDAKSGATTQAAAPAIDADATVTNLTADGSISGTPGYMSPEQLRGEPLSPASDIFQVGVVLYEMVTGQRAFARGSIAERVTATLAGPPDLSALWSMRPVGLEAFVSRALATHTSDRFATAGECLLALESLMTGDVADATPGSVVVIDFANMTGDDANDWIGASLAEAIRSDLGRVACVRVPPRLPTVRTIGQLRQHNRPSEPADVALALGLRWATSGTCERADDRLRVSFRITEAATREVKHAATLEGTVGDVVDLSRRLAEAVAAALHVDHRGGAAPAQATIDQRALERYTRARTLWQSGSGDPRILALLEEAIAIEPTYVPALAAMVPAYATRFIGSANPADLEQAIAVSDRVLALDPNNGEALVWRGYALFRLDRIDESLVATGCAVELGGDDPFPYYTHAATLLQRQPEVSLPFFQRAVQLEPRFGIGWLALGWTLVTLGRYVDARYALTRAQALEGMPGPTFLSGIGGYLAECLRAEGRLDEARVAAMAGLEAIERTDNLYRDTVRAFCLGALGRVALAQGDRDAAGTAFSQAIAQMRARTRTQGGGHVLVQALAGLAQSAGDRAAFDEARELLAARQGYSFKYFYGCDEWLTRQQLSAAADGLE